MTKYEIDTEEYNNSYSVAFRDMWSGLYFFKVWIHLSVNDIKQRYRRSVIGPLWITISNAIIISMLSLLYGALFGLPLEVYAPYLASGMLIWAFISITIIESTAVFFEYKNVIQQVNYPLSIYLYRLIARNILVLFHNFLILPIIYYIFNISLGLTDVIFIFMGFIILSVILFLVSLCSAILCTRYRDVQPLIINGLQAVFFISPIMWLPAALEGRGIASWVLTLNPIYHILDIIRSPMLGGRPANASVIISCFLIIILLLITSTLLAKTKSKIVYWL